jgi:7-cyano-7-deazaguanine synthase
LAIYESEVVSLKIVVLSSGGVDSSLLMLLLKKEGHDLYPLHINYGQIAEKKEWNSCKKICEFLELRKPQKFNFPDIRKIPSGLTDNKLDIEKNAFLPNRNLIFLVLGSAYAFSINSYVIAIGILANPIFPDQTIEFINATEKNVSESLGKKLKILAPFISLDKREILKMSIKNELPLEMTYYCHSGKIKPCGKCISCKERIAAEKEVSLKK